MKKCMTFILSLLLVISITVPAYAVNFDMTPFEEADNYTVTYDDMDDTGEVTPIEGGTILASIEGNDEGRVLLQYDIKIIEGMPPVIRLSVMYRGEDWVFTDRVIIKPAEVRYTFDVNRQTDVSNGMIYELYTIALSDESIQLLRDIVENQVDMVRCRLDGDRDIDFSLKFNQEDREYLKEFYTLYEETGSLDNDFTQIKKLFPCTIK